MGKRGGGGVTGREEVKGRGRVRRKERGGGGRRGVRGGEEGGAER